MNFYLKPVVTILVFFTVFSCNVDPTDATSENPIEKPVAADPKPEDPAPIDPDPTKPETPSEAPTNPINQESNTSFTNKEDQIMLKNLKGFIDAYDSKKYIDDYNLGKEPMHLINSSKNIAFVINPTEILEGAEKLGPNENYGLDIYKYDAAIAGAPDYFGNYNIKGSNYYSHRYSDNVIDNFTAKEEINFLAHEAFHLTYQFGSNGNWKFGNGIQDKDNFPLTKGLMELQILIGEVLKDMPRVTDKNKIREIMKKYIAIRSKEMEIDPTEKKLIKNMSLFQERLEGSAYYVNRVASNEYFKLNETYFGYKFNLPLLVNSKAAMKDNLTFGSFYAVGASVIYAISQLDRPKVQKINQTTPFEIISKIIPMTAAEKAKALQDAKNATDWKAIQSKAQLLSN